MLRLSSKITIEGDATWQFTAVVNCTIVEDVDQLTDTCELELPKNIKWEEDTIKDGKPPIKRGDKITVALGYDDKLTTRFIGYIRSVNAQVPIIIKCEDGMFILKQKQLQPKAFKNASLKELIRYVLKDTEFDFSLIDDTVMIGNYRITKPTIAEELQELKEKYLLKTYFRTINNKSVLYVGLTYPFDNRNKLVFKHRENIISESFEYKNADDIRVKVVAVTFDKKHKKTTLEIGDKDGDVIKIRVDGVSESELRKYAEQAIKRHKESGFKGSFETFGIPEVRKCDLIDLLASDGNKGVYLVKKNEIGFGIEGYRQHIEIGQTVS